MSASRVLPAWRPIHDCGQRTLSGACPQPNTFDDPVGRCFYHFKLAGGRIAENGLQSRGRPEKVKPYGNRRSAEPGGYALNRGRPVVFPYADWFDGTPRTLIRGVDFDSNIETMRENLRSAMRRHHYTAKISKQGDTLTVTPQAQPKREAGAA